MLYQLMQNSPFDTFDAIWCLEGFVFRVNIERRRNPWIPCAAATVELRMPVNVSVFWNLNSARPKAAAKIHAPEKVLSQEDRLPHLIFRKHLQSPNQVKFYVLSHMKLQFLEPWSIYGIPGVSFNLHCVHLKTCWQTSILVNQVWLTFRCVKSMSGWNVKAIIRRNMLTTRPAPSPELLIEYILKV